MTPLPLDPLTARRFMRRALLLDEPAPDLATALAHHGYIQIDPINVAGRMHDLILRNRVRDYREGGLMRHLHEDFSPGSPLARGLGAEGPAQVAGAPRRGVLPADQRTAFEHHLPAANTLVAFTLDAWPHLRGAMRSRQHRTSAWSGRLSPRQKELVPQLLAEIAARGPLSSEDFADTGRARSFWGASTQAKATLQKLFFHGRVLIARRGEGNRRYYDLPDRVLPAHILALPPSSPKDAARWEALLKLRQRRLVLLKRQELALVEDLVQPVKVEGLPLLHCLKSDLDLLEGGTRPSAAAEAMAGRPDGFVRRPTSARALKTRPPLDRSLGALSLSNGEAAFHHPILLAPLDPLIYDRRLTSALWGFDYTWEAYTPPAKRKRGYYALPVLVGHEIVGHVDPKADREKKRLRVMARALRRGHRITETLRTFAGWLGFK